MTVRYFQSLLVFVAGTLAAQASIVDEPLNSARAQYNRGEYRVAIVTLENILNDPQLATRHADSLHLMVNAAAAIGDVAAAVDAADRYLLLGPDSDHYVEVLYQRSRLLFLEDRPDDAIIALGEFVNRYPDSEYVPSAYYWIGESLTVLGRLEEADAVFDTLIRNYPSSVKREAARYRMSEIAFLYRERELLNLLKWSHEEYLKSAEDFYRRESGYRASDGGSSDPSVDPALTAEALERRFRLLDAKGRLLDLREYYVDQLMELGDVH